VTSGSPISPTTRQWLRGLAVPIATALGRLGLSPNALTVIGFVGTCAAAVAAATHAWQLAGVLVLAFGVFDMFDGALARATGRVSRFGAFLDSTFDRLGENIVLAGVAIGCATLGFDEGVALAVLAMAFSSLVTYTRAKAESLGVKGEVGIAPRPERILLIGAGLFLAGIDPNLGPASGPIPTGMACAGACVEAGGWYFLGLMAILVVTTFITVIQRIVHVRKQLEGDSNS
jgi:CDP-diacylglycerol--glycerol-3-phosphate 3-phosphatidyltransferase